MSESEKKQEIGAVGSESSARLGAWQTQGQPETNVWCLLHVREMKNVFGWAGPAVGCWTRQGWMIRQYAPDMEGGSFIKSPAEGRLEVIAWALIESPK